VHRLVAGRLQLFAASAQFMETPSSVKGISIKVDIPHLLNRPQLLEAIFLQELKQN
jgi:hypothetical protein